jgi:ligand-binding sensor domain-containing protein
VTGIWDAVVFALIALMPAASAAQLPVRSYTAADGLPGNNVRSIVKDSHGYLWFATAEGLARFDGYEFGINVP